MHHFVYLCNLIPGMYELAGSFCFSACLRSTTAKSVDNTLILNIKRRLLLCCTGRQVTLGDPLTWWAAVREVVVAAVADGMPE